MPRRQIEIPASTHDLELFRLAAEHAPVHIIFTDLEGKILYANPAAERITGYTMREMVGKRPNLWGGLMPEAFYRDMWRTIKAGKVFHGELHNRRKNGDRYAAETTISPVIEKRKLIGFVGIERDITNEKKLFQTLSEQRDTYRLALRATREAVWDWDLGAGVGTFSEGIQTVFGYGASAANVRWTWWLARVHPEDRKRVSDSLDRAMKRRQDTWSVAYRFRHADRTYRYVEDQAIIVRGKDGKATRMVGAMADVTERKDVERSLKLFRELMDRSNDAIEVLDPKTFQFLDINERGCQDLGYGRDELLSMTAFDVDPNISKKTQKDLLALLAQSSSTVFESTHRRKDGSMFPVDVSIKLVNLDRPYLVAAVHDISERKKEQEKERETEAMKNKFIKIVSHQFRTPLNAMRWNLEALSNEQVGSLTPAQKQFTKLILGMDVEVIDRTGDLLTAMDIEEGRVTLDPEDITLDSLVQTAVAEAKDQLGQKDLTCRLSVLPAGTRVMNADAAKVQVVVDKLLGNAINYSKKGGKIAVTVSGGKDVVRFEVKDTGIGIPKAEKARIFLRFFRASNASVMKPDASGLGLFIAKSFIEQHGGKMGFASTEGKGSTFWFELPIKKRV